jgi:hypothetical protein
MTVGRPGLTSHIVVEQPRLGKRVDVYCAPVVASVVVVVFGLRKYLVRGEVVERAVGDMTTGTVSTAPLYNT